jgi:type IV pilus assembly protein PilM
MALFGSDNSVVGIDIGSSSVKMLQLKRSKSGEFTLAAFGKKELPPEAIVDGSVMNTGVVVDAIKELLTENRIKTKNVVASVSGNAVIIKRISLQHMSLDELEEVIQWEAEQYIPFDISDVNIDVQILEGANPDPGQMDVLLVAARRDLVNEQLSLLQQANLKPVVIDVDSFSIANMFAANYEMPPGTIALVNVGASNVNIHILREGVSVFTRDIGMGGQQFTEEIQRTLNISYEDAERMKVGGEDTDSDAVVPQEIEEILSTVSESVAAEVQRSLDFYLSTSADGYIDQIFLSGGASRTPGLIYAINQMTGIHTEIIDPFRKVQVDERAFKPTFLTDIAPQFTVCLGLAMRTASTLEDAGELISINLMPQRQSRRYEVVSREFNNATAGLIGVGIILGGIHFFLMRDSGKLSSYNSSLQQQINKNKREVEAVKMLEGEKTSLQEKLDAIDALKRAKKGPVRMLDELAISTPEKLQLLSLSETDGRVKLAGSAASNPDISKFLTSLEDSKFFSDVYLNTIEQVEEEGIKLKSFSITARLDIPGSQPPPEEEKKPKK